jgi:hypothetical protein
MFSNLAFKFNLRRCIQAASLHTIREGGNGAGAGQGLTLVHFPAQLNRF